MSISRVAGGFANAATASLSGGWLPGDFCIVFAHRDGSTTAPSLPAGWTSIDASGANTNSARTGFRYLKSGDTDIGTWTNATSVEFIIYEGVRRDYGTTFLPNIVVNGNTGTSITYSALTLRDTRGNSWVVGLAGHRTATNVNQAPSGMTLIGGTANGDAGASDTNAGVASWSSASVTVNASSGWRSAVVELQVSEVISSLIIQRVRFNNSSGYQDTDWRFPLPHPSQAGNTIVVHLNVGLGSGTISTVTVTRGDNLGTNTYTSRVDVSDDPNGARLITYTVIGAGAGTQLLQFQFSTAVAVQCYIEELYGISGFDVAHGQANAGSTSWSAGAMTLGSAGDYVSFAALQDFGGSAFSPFIPMVGMALTSSDRRDGFVTQSGIRSSSGSFTPTITAQSLNNIAGAIALTVDTSVGTPIDPSQWRVLGIQWHQLTAGPNYNDTTTGALKFPCKGNTILGAWLGGTSTSAVSNMTAVTDNVGNTHNLTTANDVSSAGAAQHSRCIGSAITCSDLSIDITTDSSDNVTDIALLDVNAPTGASFGQAVNVSGLQSGAGDLAMGAGFTPGNNSLVVLAGGINEGTTREETSGKMVRMHPYTANEDGNTSSLHEDNPWAVKVTTSTASISATFAVSQPVADWVGQYLELTAPAPSSRKSAVVQVLDGVKRKPLTPHGFYLTPRWIRAPGVNGLATLGALAVVGTAIAPAHAGGVATLGALSGSGTAITAGSASGVATLAALSVSGTAVTGVSASPPLHPQVIVTELTHERRRREAKLDRTFAVPITLILTYQTPIGAQASGAATLPGLTAVGTAKVVVHPTGAAVLATLTGSGTAKAIVQANGVAFISGFKGVGTASSSPTAAHAIGVATLPALAGSGTAKAKVHSTGTETLATLAVTGAAKAIAKASGSAVLVFRVVGQATGTRPGTPQHGKTRASFDPSITWCLFDGETEVNTAHVKQSDTNTLTATLFEADGTPANLVGATVVFTARSRRTGALLVDRGTADVLDAANGRVSFSWLTLGGGPPTAGSYRAEWRATFVGSPAPTRTYPNDGSATLDVPRHLY